MSSKTRQQLESWLKDLPEVSGNVLDIGGSQLPIFDRVKFKMGTKFVILDLANPHEVKESPLIEQDLNLPMHTGTAGFEDTFDHAFCMEVSEYWYDPMQALYTIGKLLKKGGSLYISFHFVYPVHNPIEQDYLRYTREGAMLLLEKAGFQIKGIKSRHLFSSFDLMQEMIKAEGMRPAKQADIDEIGVLIHAIKK